jgi:FKBP-type peptidyl-prolyl cis-trans isomerase 2
MPQAKIGDTVKVHYTGKLTDGTVFDSSTGKQPLEFKLGQGQLIPGFEQAVNGMEPGDSKTIDIQADDAYGQHREELTQKVPRQQLPADIEIEVGQRFQIGEHEGQPMIVQVTEVGESDITLDANHPLAGENLAFDIQLMEIA